MLEEEEGGVVRRIGGHGDSIGRKVEGKYG